MMSMWQQLYLKISKLGVCKQVIINLMVIDGKGLLINATFLELDRKFFLPRRDSFAQYIIANKIHDDAVNTYCEVTVNPFCAWNININNPPFLPKVTIIKYQLTNYNNIASRIRDVYTSDTKFAFNIKENMRPIIWNRKLKHNPLVTKAGECHNRT